MPFFRRAVFVLLSFCALGPLCSRAEADSFNVKIAAGIVSPAGETSWMESGKSTIGTGKLELSFLSDRDCYFYAIANFDGKKGSIVLWPPLVTAEIVKVRKGETLTLRHDSAEALSARSGSLAVLVFASPPLRLHAALRRENPSEGEIERMVRRVFQENSPFMADRLTTPTLIAGTIRSGRGDIRGADINVDSFWGGVYEWVAPLPR